MAGVVRVVKGGTGQFPGQQLPGQQSQQGQTAPTSATVT
ncbi:hypothetical protein N803_15470 [Knoellia subterranea KCTC 19937]|uniref:Uncharacterized protein n=1 Tax=Knoellia subterranea KCTC 19937 TaxID=1385521 RepID=A0A0A0JJN5_9MICO|nr:hypothetical protein N803_15470 [Knoellia subterranea KCTC 19937]